MRKNLYILLSVLVLLLGLGGCITPPIIPDKGIKPKNPFVMNSYFSDNMVLQRNQPITIFGKSEEDVLIEVNLYKKEASEPTASGKVFVDESGDWKIVLPALDSSYQLYKLTITDSINTREIKDILVGEVWLTSGEKNMTWPMRYTKDASSYIINNENTKYIRYFSQNHYPKDNPAALVSALPQDDFSNGHWHLANNLASVDASAISYIFACELFSELNKGSDKVPVAFIESAVEESNIHAWLPKWTIDANPYLRNYLETHNLYLNDFNNQGNSNYNQMSVLYNHKINPLKGISFKGVIWYQGLSDIDYFDYYNEALRTLIDSWRKEFAQDISFVIVGEHSYQKDNLADFRNAQIVGTNYHQNVVLVPTFDLEFEYEYQPGYDMNPLVDSSLFYPINKIEVALRIEKAVLSLVYQKTEKYLSPHLHNYTVSVVDNCINLYFAHTNLLHLTEENLLKDLINDQSNYQNIVNLEIVLNDGSTEEANVQIETNILKIYCSDITQVKAVKYAYIDLNKDSNLFNEMDLPVLPFFLNIKWYQK